MCSTFSCLCSVRLKVLKLLLRWDCRVSEEEEEVVISSLLTHRQGRFCVCNSFSCLCSVRLKVLKLLLGSVRMLLLLPSSTGT